MTSQADGRTLRLWFTVTVVLAILAAVGLILAPVRGAIAWAAFLAFLLLPLQRALTRRLGGRAYLAAGVLTGLAPFVLLVPLALLGLEFAQQVSALVTPLQGGSVFSLEALQDPVQHPRLARLAEWTALRLHLGPEAVHGYLVATLKRYAATLAAAGGQLVLSAAGGFLRFFLMLFILFFLLRDGESAFLRMTRLLPLEPARRDALLDRLARVTRAVVYGAGLTALCQGALVGSAFALIGLPGPVVFGVLAAVLALLPVGGTGLVWVPGVLVLLAQDRLGAAAFLAAWGLGVVAFDSVVRPALISHQTPVPTLLVFLGVLGGVAAFGVIGFVFGPVILVLATELLRFAEPSLDRNSPTPSG
jgi:predicted PurR-regulated permease PerM